jgi:hypothetical protein
MIPTAPRLLRLVPRSVVKQSTASSEQRLFNRPDDALAPKPLLLSELRQAAIKSSFPSNIRVEPPFRKEKVKHFKLSRRKQFKDMLKEV